MSRAAESELTNDECREYLALKTVGRIAFVHGGRLELLPVNFAFVNGAIYLSTAPESVLAALADGVPVVFEADHLEDLLQMGWSIVARGTSRSIGESEVRALETPPHPWAPGERDLHIRIDVDELTGKRVRSR